MAQFVANAPSTPGYSGITSSTWKNTSILSAGFTPVKPSSALTFKSFTDSGFTKGADRLEIFSPGRNQTLSEFGESVANSFRTAVHHLEYIDRPRTLDLPAGFMANVDFFSAAGTAVDFRYGGGGSGRLATASALKITVYHEAAPWTRVEFKIGTANIGKPSDINGPLLAAGIATLNPVAIGAALVGFQGVEVTAYFNGPLGNSFRQPLYPEVRAPVLRTTPGW